MHYNLRKILCSTALALVISLTTNSLAMAQGTVSLEESDTPELTNNGTNDFLGVDNTIPDEISLFETNNADDEALAANSGLISPPAPEEQVDAPMPETETEAEADEVENIIIQAPQDEVLTNDNNYPSLPLETSATVSTPESQPTVDIGNNFGDGILNQVDNELFSQMSDLERQTALLTLELRREKVKNEIEAIKSQREKAIDEVKAKEEEKAQKKAAWEKEQEKKILEEKQKLKEISIELEKLRQEKILNAYKNSMLTSSQDWIKNNEEIYKELTQAESDREFMANDFKKKLAYLSSLSSKAAKDAEIARTNYNREVSNLQTQISILKARLEAEKAEKENSKANPFAQVVKDENVKPVEEEIVIKLPEEYVIMEIRGKGETLVAKLINKAGDSFMVRKGTALQTGHVVDEITQTYIRAEKDGIKDYVYFSAGGILEKEPINIKPKTKTDKDAKEKPEEGSTLQSSAGVPSLGRGMFVR